MAEDKVIQEQIDELWQKDPKTVPFIHLHVHTEYSLLDGAARLLNGHDSPLLDEVKAQNMPSIAITDHGSMYGVYTFQNLAREHSIKPIIGCEFYVCDNMHDRTNQYYHMLLLAKDNEGYKNIVKMDSLAYLEGFYYKPRIDLELLKKHSKGVICTSACIGGSIPQYLLNNDYESAKEYAIKLRDIFEPGDFYIEIQDHGLAEEKRVNPQLVKIAREIGVKVVATNDIHYIKKSDWKMHDVLLCIQTGKLLTDEKRMKFDTNEFYLKSTDEMRELFSWCPESLITPYEIMLKCNTDIKKEELMPPYKPDDGSNPDEFLRKLTYERLKSRYPEPNDEIIERIEYELGIITRMGFCEYYLIVWDFIDFARRHDIPVGAGRGSGVGSIVAYIIGITNVNPLKYNLLFERFLNPERVSNPDFDIDFCVEGRAKVIEYVQEKYGADKVSQILALGTMATKNAIKDVARVYNVPLAEVNRLTKLIPMGKVKLKYCLGLDEAHANEAIPELVEAYQTDPTMQEVLSIALQLEGMPRNCSKHAAGVVICKEVISDFVPLCKTGEDVTTQFQKDEVEMLGMLKMDFLGLRTLTDIDKAKKYIAETTGDVVDFAVLGYDDSKVYDLISTGETDAVFQLESAGMKNFMKQLMPRTLEDIIAGISLFRPGPMDSIPKYVESKNDPNKISYDHEMLEPILNMTYGCIVYQEQVMQIVQKLGGYTLGRADLLRRAMGKKKVEVMAEERKVFLYGQPAKPAKYNEQGIMISGASTAVDGALSKGVPEKVAMKIFDDMESFAKYAFNKSHAAAYAVVAYETAYLKLYYPVQFITAVINNRITNADELSKYIEYLRATGVEVLPPNINLSEVYFKCEGKGTRFGLMGIKNVGEAAISLVVEERKKNGDYKSFSDFFRRTSDFNLNKRLIECLIKGGAFDIFGYNRATLLANYESEMSKRNYDKKARQTGQLTMFSMTGFMDNLSDDLREVNEFDKNELLAMEKEVLNVYMSGHPLDDHRDELQRMAFNLEHIKTVLEKGNDDNTDEEDDAASVDTAVLIKEYDGKKVCLGGMITDFRRKTTKTGKVMAMLTVEDLYASIDVVVFPRNYEMHKALLEKDNIIKLYGELQLSGRPQIVMDKIELWNKRDTYEAEPVKTVEVKSKERLYLNLMNKENLLDEIKSVALSYQGSSECFIQMRSNGVPKLMRLTPGVDINDLLLIEIESILGKDSYKVVDNTENNS